MLSTEDITIFTYHDLKLGQIIKDQELLKLILRALKWNEVGKSIEYQLDKLKNTSFRTVLGSPDLLHDEDLMQLLGPYIDHGSFMGGSNANKPGLDYNSKLMEQNTVTEMEVGVDPELFFPYDDDESKSIDVQEEVPKTVVRTKKETTTSRKVSSKNNGANKKSVTTITETVMPKIKVVKTSVLQKPHLAQASLLQPAPILQPATGVTAAISTVPVVAIATTAAGTTAIPLPLVKQKPQQKQKQQTIKISAETEVTVVEAAGAAAKATSKFNLYLGPL